MKNALIASVVLSLFVVSGVVLAEQAAAPAAPAAKPAAPAAAAPAPAPAAPAAAAPAPAAPAAAPAAPAKAAPAASLTITRMDVAGSIADRKPAGISASFPASQDKVYCYLEFKDVAKDQTITYAWTFGQDTDKVTQQVKKAARWRTWGNKSIAGRTGDWKVEVLDENGTVLKSASFKVE